MKATIPWWRILRRQTITEFAMQNNPLEKTGRDISAEIPAQPVSLPLPGSNAYGDLPQFTKNGVLPFRRTIRRQELRQIVPLLDRSLRDQRSRKQRAFSTRRMSDLA